MFLKDESIHFVGIGGAGMYPLAELMVKNGYTVTGSDKQHSYTTEHMESLGVKIQYNHLPNLVKNSDILVYSSAVKSDNEELIYAANHGIANMKRAEMLGDIMGTKFSIGIAGTHGKTTTTSLIGTIMRDAEIEPTVIVGGSFKDTGSNAIIGNGNVLVVEADEYDRSVLSMFPSIAVITNIEEDHLDIYKDLNDIIDAFIKYANTVPFYGEVIICTDDPTTMQNCDRIDKTVIKYGTFEKADYKAFNIKSTYGKSQFNVMHNGTELGMIELPLAGFHNILNALAAVTVALEMKISFDVIKKSLKNFKGMKRRFEIIGKENNITVIDDYAHHPTEIKATLSSAENMEFKRVIAVFQPHLYSRTRDFLDNFAESLKQADIAIVTGIYKAREDPIEGVSGEDIVEKLHEMGKSEAMYVEKTDDLTNVLLPRLEPNDCVVLMGAGDIWTEGSKLLNRIKHG